MLTNIILLTSLIFAVTYPLCFWVNFGDPLKNNFHRFHLGLPVVVGGVLLSLLFYLDFPSNIIIPTLIWELLLFLITYFYWKKDAPDPRVVSVPCLWGIYVYMLVQGYLLNTGLNAVIIGVIGGCIFSASLFAMNLGHWYLNVHGLPMKYLHRATYAFWILLLIRAIWDTYFLLTSHIDHHGYRILLVKFISEMDGFLLIIALFFGTLFPILALFFANGTLKVKNTQATTGILYAILCSICIGELTYKYYLIQYGIAL